MRTSLLCIFAMFALVLSSCETSNINKPLTPTLELTSNETLRVDHNAGVYEITYTIENPVEGERVKAQVVNSQMITAVDTSDMGVVNVTLSENTTDTVREGAVVVSYGALSFTVVIEQNFNADGDIERVSVAANQLVGTYYGDNLVAGVAHYWLIFSNDGFVDGSVVPNSEFFRLDVLGPMPEDEENVRIPDGTYYFDYSAMGVQYSIVDIGNTDYTYVDENLEGWATAIDYAELKVSGNSFELIAMVGTTEYTVTFEGEYSLATSVITDYVSSLTKDAVIDVSNCSASVSSYGDYWGCGYNNWCIEFLCNDGMKYGTYLVIDFLNNSTTDFTGTYVASGFSAEDETMPDFRANVFVPGFRVADDADLLLGSLYMVYNEGVCISQAPLYEGTVTITSNGDGTYTIIVDALDDAPRQNRITLSWTGKFE